MLMAWGVYSIIVLYFMIGAVSIYFINKKSDATTAKERWTKYFFYFIHVGRKQRKVV